MVRTQLYTSQIILQIIVGTLMPIALLGMAQLLRLTETGTRSGSTRSPAC